MGDRRLNQRATQVLERLFEAPQAGLKGAMQGWAEMMGAYRLFDHPQCTQEALLQPHHEAVLERVRQHKRVLVIQDTSELDYTTHTQLEGKGPLASNERQGFFLHTQWVVSDQRLPLGAWRCQIDARDAAQIGQSHQRKQLPIEAKESYRWLEGYRAACDLARQSPGVQIISCSDRESDIFEVFAEWDTRQQNGEVVADWLIRCEHNRAVLDSEVHPLVPGVPKRLLEQLAQGPALGMIEFEVHTKEQFKKIKGNRKRSVRQARKVCQEIRAAPITLRPPHRPGHKLPEVTVWVVMATEIDPPAGQDPINWILLTSLPVRNFEEAKEILKLYLARWEIEVFHRVLKTGCRIEKLQLKSHERLKPAIALYLIVAWRILFLMKLGRECPQLPCDVVFDESEWKPLYVIVHGVPAPSQPPSLGEMILMIARFGGYAGRKKDGPPGPEAMWRGLQCLRCFSIAWKSFGPDSS